MGNGTCCLRASEVWAGVRFLSDPGPQPGDHAPFVETRATGRRGALLRNKQNAMRILQGGCAADAGHNRRQMAGLGVQLHDLALPSAVRVALLERCVYPVGRVASIGKKHERLARRAGSWYPAGVIDRSDRAVLVVEERQC